MSATTKLPVIVGFGGYNAAGRVSGHHAYHRLVFESLDKATQDETVANLAVLMGLATYAPDGTYSVGESTYTDASTLAQELSQTVLENTLIRRIDPETYFDPDKLLWQKKATLKGSGEQAIEFTLRKRDLPEPVPAEWQVFETDDSTVVRVQVSELADVKIDSYRDFPVKSAGQLPKGFKPADHYSSRFHPRAVQMSVLGASDAIRSIGIPWEVITSHVTPDAIGVYSSNIMAQMDEFGAGGLLKSRLQGGRVSTKNLILGLNSMTTDFINAYMIGSVGSSGSTTGACASFLYNLATGIEEIRSGRKRVVIVGGSEAPITSEVIDGYSTMGALATEDNQRKLYGVEEVDHRRSSRPFSENCGFTIAESSQYVVLMDDELALELGADIHAAVADVFLSADGYKKSISAPGPGNFITLAKAVASANAIFGEEVTKKHSILLAHGSSTPKNRTTESEIFDRVAEAFGISEWPVIAVKAFLGHSLAPASGDQVTAALGMFKSKILPGIKTADAIAEDVFADRLKLSVTDQQFEGELDIAFINSKGFGGANGSAILISPQRTESMLIKRYGKERVEESIQRREATVAAAKEYDRKAAAGDLQVIYQFGEGMIDEAAIEITQEAVKLPGFELPINLKKENPYGDMI
ncbi:beta-ketoacyl synthase [Halioxenophilus sp. WMMB6]|uniref:beta-ketoacyl synthase n=1 Tax=Halioxenophilus sp. WMMB6 TaxID=3073815 RepID=UPI00295F1A31|nr:beta-ketoacyl synthase [Halioxenophilus sp. WMMB6]